MWWGWSRDERGQPIQAGDDIAAANEQLFASAQHLAESAAVFYSGHGGPFSREDLPAAPAALAAAEAEAAVAAG